MREKISNLHKRKFIYFNLTLLSVRQETKRSFAINI